jgi:hypothetical protein
MPCLSRLRRRLALVQVIEGEVDAVEKRRCDRSVMEHLAASGIAMEAVAITGDGCSFIIDSRDGARFASAIVNLNVALKFHDRLAS